MKNDVDIVCSKRLNMTSVLLLVSFLLCLEHFFCPYPENLPTVWRFFSFFRFCWFRTFGNIRMSFEPHLYFDGKLTLFTNPRLGFILLNLG